MGFVRNRQPIWRQRPQAMPMQQPMQQAPFAGTRSEGFLTPSMPVDPNMPSFGAVQSYAQGPVQSQSYANPGQFAPVAANVQGVAGPAEPGQVSMQQPYGANMFTTRPQFGAAPIQNYGRLGRWQQG